MQKLKSIIVASALIAATGVMAESHNMNNMDHSKMNHAQMNHDMGKGNGMAYHNEMMTREGFNVTLSSDKPLTNGNNEMHIMIGHQGMMVNDAQVKVKFFMPEMPGMPYMEHKGNAKFEDGKYKCDVNLSMNGTWQYQIKFKTADGKVQMVKGSVNY